MAFEEDNFEEHRIEVVQAEPDMLLDVLAKNKHYDTPAADAHRNIAARLWPHLKALEYTAGRLLAIGSDIDLLAGAPPGTPPVADYLDGYEVGDTLATDVPGAGKWPHDGLRLRPALDNDIGRADLVIANIPLVDARTLTRENKIDVALAHHQVIRDTLDWLRPGGLLVALVHRQLLDGTDAQPRRSIARHADLIAAARLPSSALRKAPLLDSPVDLLLLRRREPGHPPGGLKFIDRSPVHVHDVPDMLINECYATAPWAAVGNIVPDPIEPDLTTVAPLGGDFGRALSDALATHTDIAIDDRLYAQERPTRTSGPRPPSAGTSQAQRPGPDVPTL